MVDKPAGVTSHDVVAVARRVLGQSRIGHTGTLDPFATGVLPLACGRATRLVRFMSAAEKTYEATIRFGLVTDTYDITGTELSRSDVRPSADEVLRAVKDLEGDQWQVPPAFSAKKIDGRRAYDLARRQQAVELPPAAVRLDSVEIVSLTTERALIRLTCSAGYYVRSFAHDLGQRVGSGACLEALRRTGSGQFSLQSAVTLDVLQAEGAGGHMVPLQALLPGMSGVVVNEAGRRRLAHGQTIRPEDVIRAIEPGPVSSPRSQSADSGWVRVFDEAGEIVGVAQGEGTESALRPTIVLT